MLQRRHTTVHSSMVAFTWPRGMFTTTLVVGTGAVEVEGEDGVSVLWHSEAGGSEVVSGDVLAVSTVSTVSMVEDSAVSEERVTVSCAAVDNVVDADSGVLVTVPSVDGGTHGELDVSSARAAELIMARVATRAAMC